MKVIQPGAVPRSCYGRPVCSESEALMPRLGGKRLLFCHLYVLSLPRTTPLLFFPKLPPSQFSAILASSDVTATTSAHPTPPGPPLQTHQQQTSNSPPIKPTVIGIYGLPSSVKTYLVNILKRHLHLKDNPFSFYDGPDFIKKPHTSRRIPRYGRERQGSYS